MAQHSSLFPDTDSSQLTLSCIGQEQYRTLQCDRDTLPPPQRRTMLWYKIGGNLALPFCFIDLVPTVTPLRGYSVM